MGKQLSLLPESNSDAAADRVDLRHGEHQPLGQAPRRIGVWLDATVMNLNFKALPPATATVLWQSGLYPLSTPTLHLLGAITHDTPSRGATPALRSTTHPEHPEPTAPCLVDMCLEAPRLLCEPRLTRSTFGVEHVRVNPAFLDARFFVREIWRPTVQHMGNLRWFVLRIAPGILRTGMSPEAFARRLQRFFEVAPREVPWALEISEGQLLTSQLADVLHQFGVASMLSFSPSMPSLAEQRHWAGDGCLVARVPPGWHSTRHPFHDSEWRRWALLARLLVAHPQAPASVWLDGTEPHSVHAFAEELAKRAPVASAPV